jgi:hypothetical protein
MTTATAAIATTTVKITWTRGGGAARRSAIARSTLRQRSHETKAENRAAAPSRIDRLRTAQVGHGRSMAKRAAAAASRPRDVRIHARKVRSLASEYRGSGSSFTAGVSHRRSSLLGEGQCGLNTSASGRRGHPVLVTEGWILSGSRAGRCRRRPACRSRRVARDRCRRPPAPHRRRSCGRRSRTPGP